MKKVNVKICVGTACYLIGGSELMSLPDLLPPEIKPCVEFKFAECMERCDCEKENGRPPFVRVDDEIISGATVESVICAIQKHLDA